jgi:hypothetical protein
LPAAPNIFSRGEVAAASLRQGQLAQAPGYAPQVTYSGTYWTLAWPATVPFVRLSFLINPAGIDKESGEAYPPFLSVGFETPPVPQEAQQVLFGRVGSMDPVLCQVNIPLPMDELEPRLLGQAIWPFPDPALPNAVIVPGVVGVRFPLKTKTSQAPTVPTHIC